MFGTIARVQVAEGKDEAFLAHLKAYESINIDGFVSEHVYKADKGGGEYWLTVVFESREKYTANADSAEQNTRYEEFRSLLKADPEWHDGEIVASS